MNFIGGFYSRVIIVSLFLYLFFTGSRLIKKKYVFLFFALLFSFAYIFSPYWIAFHSPLSRIICLIILFLYGLSWSCLISGDLNIQKNIKTFWVLILCFLIYFINYRPLNADIPWRGDESYHILLTMDLFTQIKNGSGVFIDELLRYPYIQKWLSLLFVFPDLYTDVKLYRIIPFISVLFIAIFLFYKFEEKLNKPILSLLFSLSMVTVPLVYFYTSLLYLEMPIVFLMIVCIFDIKSTLSLPFKEMSTRPQWYCLLLISFLKETAVIFLLLIVLLRFIYQIKANIKSSQLVKIIFSEIILYFLLLSPVMIYLFFRNYFSILNQDAGRFDNSLNINNYLIIIQSLLSQLGVLFITGIAGCFYLYIKKQKVTLIVLLIMFAGIILFFMINTPYIGYSRWNLFILPLVIYCSFIFITSLNKIYSIIVLISLFAFNIFLSPFLIDGTRLPNWGSPRADIAEYCYPYGQAIKFLSDNKSTQHLLLFGQYFPYNGLEFYLNKYNFHPEIIRYDIDRTTRFDADTERLFFNDFFKKTLVREESIPRIDTILYHSVNNVKLNINDIYGNNFKISGKISNSFHTIYVFQKDNE
jgi:hypothetical protein